MIKKVRIALWTNYLVTENMNISKFFSTSKLIYSYCNPLSKLIPKHSVQPSQVFTRPFTKKPIKSEKVEIKTFRFYRF